MMIKCLFHAVRRTADAHAGGATSGIVMEISLGSTGY